MVRTTYMQQTMKSTYSGIAMEAIKNGWDGAWERLIAQRLRIDYKSDHSEAFELINSCTPAICDDYNIAFEVASMKAAYLITSSTIQSHEQTT